MLRDRSYSFDWHKEKAVVEAVAVTKILQFQGMVLLDIRSKGMLYIGDLSKFEPYVHKENEAKHWGCKCRSL